MAAKDRILVVDDEESMRDSCRQMLEKDGHEVKVAGDAEGALRLISEQVFDVIILDLRMPGMDGMELLERIRRDDPQAVVVVITGYATVQSAVEAMKKGAYDFLPKPFAPDEFRLIIKRALEKRKLALENIRLRETLRQTEGEDVIIGRSKPMQEVLKLIEKVSPTDSTVLICGESGTGKELVARAIHRNSKRRNKPFVTVDCGSLVESLFESELFGHVKGSFTGATTTKHGRFELADGGTLFFDEIGNIGINVQAKLLRAIQEREICKVGSSKTVPVDVRIIAATNKDLERGVREGTFREELFYRLSVVPIYLPPLRERMEDVPLLANYFLEKFNKKRGKNIKAISDKAMEALMQHDWPGNVRELENVIERAVVLADGEVIQPRDLSYYGLTAMAPQASRDWNKSLADVEREHIARTLKRFGGHKGKTAELLGIDRKTLRAKMRKYGLE